MMTEMTSPQEETVMSEDNTLENMIDYAANADFNKANAVFNDMIAQKMDAVSSQASLAGYTAVIIGSNQMNINFSHHLFCHP